MFISFPLVDTPLTSAYEGPSSFAYDRESRLPLLFFFIPILWTKLHLSLSLLTQECCPWCKPAWIFTLCAPLNSTFLKPTPPFTRLLASIHNCPPPLPGTATPCKRPPLTLELDHLALLCPSPSFPRLEGPATYPLARLVLLPPSLCHHWSLLPIPFLSSPLERSKVIKFVAPPSR